MPERSENETYRGRHNRIEEDGNAIGLTEAFDPINDYLDGGDSFEEDRPFDDALEFEDASKEDSFVDEEDEEDELPVKRGRHARHAKVEVEFDDADDEEDAFAGLGVIGAAAEFEEVDASEGSQQQSGKKRRKHAADELPRYMKKSRRMRNILIAAIVALILLASAGAFFAWQLFETAQHAAEEQAGSQSGETIIESEATDNASSVSAKKVSAPNLVALLDMTEEAALAQLGEGANVSSRTEFNAEGSRVKEDEEVAYTELTVSLTADASDPRLGYPSVYLVVDAQGKVVQAGYSTTTTLLGFGSQSFEDVVKNGRIVETTLQEAGVSVAAGDVELPADKATYTTYAEDGTTLVKEYCSFEGKADAGEDQIVWSAALSYDYAMSNATGNLGDTVRVIYLYVE